MLSTNNRLDYGDILAPPAGCYLDCAVGTTYSLDLDTLTGASLAMGLSANTDSDMNNDPVYLLEALRCVGDKVALFCESGQIHLPSKPTALYILLEKMVFPVRTRRHRGKKSYPAFHPKFWLIRYIDEYGEALYRVIVLSRNMTFDRSWDIAYCMEGKVTGRKLNKNKPVCDFLNYLLKQIPRDENGKEKARMIRQIIREFLYVKFEIREKEFWDYEFIPVGIRDEEEQYYSAAETDLFTSTFHEIFIMSPFLTSNVIRDFNERDDGYGFTDPKYVLITRKTALPHIKKDDVSNFTIYTMRDEVIDGESSISDDTAQIMKQDIHAKIYMLRKHSDTDLYLGSLNATNNAVYENVEFMIRLASRNRFLNIEKLTGSLFGKDEKANPFQKTTIKDQIKEDENYSKQHEMEQVIKTVDRSDPSAIVEEADGRYTVKVSFGECDTNGYETYVKPLLSFKSMPLDTLIVFSGLDMIQLSEFYVLSVSDGEQTIERVITIPTIGIPEEREKAVVSKVVSDEKSFYKYIAFLLDDSSIAGMFESNEEVMHAALGSKKTYVLPSLYEKMLKTAATAPERFRGIQYLMDNITDENIVNDDFRKLFEKFKKAVKLDA